MKRRVARVCRCFVLILPLAQAAQAADVVAGEGAADAARHAEVARRGAEVMRFELARTTHVFTKTASGGRQRVVAKDPREGEQVRAVRMHLRTIDAQFRRGDYSAPAQIHGGSMAGLDALRSARPGAIAIRYADVPGGGELSYSARDPTLIAALHRWFDAQLAEHGADAREGHSHPGSGHAMHVQ